MAEVGSTIALLALIGVGVWLFGSFALRVGGLVLFFLGLFGLLTGTTEALVILIMGAVGWLGGHWLYRVKHGAYKSPVAAGILERTPLDRGAPSYEDAWDAHDRVGEQDEPCAETGKVKFADEDTAVEAVERNQERHDRGLQDYRLERAYMCEFCSWWHVTSQTKRGVS